MRKLSTLSGKVKKTPSIQADPNRYDFLDLKNAEPDLGVPPDTGYFLTSDASGNRSWSQQVEVTEVVTTEYINTLAVDANTLNGEIGDYYLDFTNFTNIPDPTVEVNLTGDATGFGSATLTDLANGSITINVTVQDDSHNHTIENVDGLQDVLDGKIDVNANTILQQIITVDGAGSGLDADLLDGQEGSYYLDWVNISNKPDPNIQIILTGDVTGSGNTTLTDIENGSISISTSIEGGANSNIDADRLDGEEGTFYLDYTNFTNTPDLSAIVFENSANLVTTDTNQVVDQFSTSEIRSSKYFVQMTANSEFQVSEVLLIHDGVNSYITEYGNINTNASLGSIDSDIVSGSVRLLVSPVQENTLISLKRISLSV